jgi:WD40 repeat protein
LGPYRRIFSRNYFRIPFRPKISECPTRDVDDRGPLAHIDDPGLIARKASATSKSGTFLAFILCVKKILVALMILGALYSANSFSEEIKLPIDAGHETSFAWSKDSSEIAIGTEDVIYIVDASSGDLVKKIEAPGFTFDIDWSPDGKKLAIHHTDEVTVHYPSDIFIIDLTDGAAENVTHAQPYTYCRTPRWSPDGRFIVFTFERRDTVHHEESDELEHIFTEEVATLNLETGQINTLGAGCCPEWSKDHHKLVVRASYSSIEPYSIDYDEDSQELLPNTKSLITSEQRVWLLYGINERFPQKIRQVLCEEECLSPDGEKLIIKISTSVDHSGFILKKN